MALPIRKDGGSPHSGVSTAARKACRMFLRFFPGGFYDQKYIDWERGYKWAVHQAWEHTLNRGNTADFCAARSSGTLPLWLWLSVLRVGFALLLFRSKVAVQD